MKFSMLAIAGAAIAAGVEGFSAVRTAGVRQVSGCPLNSCPLLLERLSRVFFAEAEDQYR